MTISAEQLNKLKFPIGPFAPKENISQTELDEFIKTIKSAPAAYRAITENLSDSDFNKTYREGAWTVRQLVNHLADMHLLHFFRMKKALTEPDYKEITLVDIPAWANTADCTNYPVADSLDILDAITRRYVHLIKSLSEAQLAIAYYHPVRKITLNQKQAVQMTAWHVRHHLEHIKIALGRS